MKPYKRVPPARDIPVSSWYIKNAELPTSLMGMAASSSDDEEVVSVPRGYLREAARAAESLLKLSGWSDQNLVRYYELVDIHPTSMLLNNVIFQLMEQRGLVAANGEVLVLTDTGKIISTFLQEEDARESCEKEERSR